MARVLRSFGSGSSNVASGALERDGSRVGVGATEGSSRTVRATAVGLGDGLAAPTAGAEGDTTAGLGLAVGDGTAERDACVGDDAEVGRALVGAGVGRGEGVGLGEGAGAPVIVIVPLIAVPWTEQK